MTLRVLFTLSLALLLAACTERGRLLEIAREAGAVRESQEDFWILDGYRKGVICGRWDVEKPGGRDREGFRNFILLDGSLNKNPNREQWAVYCTDTPEEVLFTRFGFERVPEQGGSLRQIYADLAMLDEALVRYRKDQGNFPYDGDGLKTLLPTDVETGRNPEARQRGYIEAVPKDPWGRDYYYEYSGLGGGVLTRYALYTLGADGEPGGTGEDADVSTQFLPYLRYAFAP